MNLGNLTPDQINVIFPFVIAAGFCLVAIIGHLGYRFRLALWLYNTILGVIILGCYGIATLVALTFILYRIDPHKFAALSEHQLGPFFFFGPSLLLTAVMGTMVLIPPARRWLHRYIPGDANALLHRYALLSTLLVISMQLYMLKILTPEMIKSMLHSVNFFISTCTMQMVLLIITVCGSGLGITRGWRAMLDRLGVRKISWKLAGGMFALAIALFLAVTVIEIVVLARFSPDAAELGKEMAAMVQLHQPLYIAVPLLLVLSMFIGTGEELFFRGLLQPAVGIILSSLLFAFIHTQYGLTPVILILFLVSLLFGWIRNKYGVVAAILLHGFYDFFNFVQIQL